MILHSLLCCLLVLGVWWLSFFGQAAQAATGNTLTWAEVTAPSQPFAKADRPKTWQFPADFGPHPDYKSEWWYYTGNLETAEHRPFGFQLTFFRQALSPESPQPATPAVSQWRGHQIYSAHFTVSDIAQQQFYVDERFERGNLGLANATAQPYQVWLGAWSAQEQAPGQVKLQASQGEVNLNLLINQTLAPVLQGDQGLSIKGKEPGNASYYYSLVQQPTTGTIQIKDQTYNVTGLTWKDHEYSTSALSPGTVGWDWFSAQFENGSALMLYLLRHEDGAIESTSGGSFIAANGQVQQLTAADISVQATSQWHSPKSGGTYPAQWQVQVPKLNLTLKVTPLMANQELNTATATYWEGAVSYQGQQGDVALQGKGYVELTGYADRLDALLAQRT
jgi:predicted secreted hydrolase